MSPHACFCSARALVALVLVLGVARTPARAADFAKPGHPIAAAQSWAAQVIALARGPLDAANPGLGNASAGLPENALGSATGSSADTVSLGDGGHITLRMRPPLFDAIGDDFAVYENGFYSVDGLFGELAFVEVSSNGVDFARFPAQTLAMTPVPSFGTLDPDLYANLAGDQPAGLGAGFDLAELETHALVLSGALALARVRYVRVVDAIGDGSTQDSLGAPIYDPYPTPFPTGGFDLDAVGALHAVELPVGFAALLASFGVLLLAGGLRLRGALPARALLALLALCGHAAPAGAASAGFDDTAALLGLGSESFYNGADAAGGFASGGVSFENLYDPGFGVWSGFAVSNTTDTTTPGFGNQYSAIPGSGAAGTAAYGVSFVFGEAVARFASDVDLVGAFFTNTTYAFLTLRDGDFFTDPFGGPSGGEPDLFRLRVLGYDSSDALVGEVELALADYRSPDASGDFILETWTWLDLTPLRGVRALHFQLDSTDVGPFGSNTPAYFGIDELSFTAIPEPGSALLLGAGLAALAARRRRSGP